MRNHLNTLFQFRALVSSGICLFALVWASTLQAQDPTQPRLPTDAEKEVTVVTLHKIPYPLMAGRLITVESGEQSITRTYGDTNRTKYTPAGTAFIAYFNDVPFIFTGAHLLADLRLPDFRLASGRPLSELSPALAPENISSLQAWVHPESKLAMIKLPPELVKPVDVPEYVAVEEDKSIASKSKEVVYDYINVEELLISDNVDALNRKIFEQTSALLEAAVQSEVLGNLEGGGIIDTASVNIQSISPDLIKLGSTRLSSNSYSGSPLFHQASGEIVGVLLVDYEDMQIRQLAKQVGIRESRNQDRSTYATRVPSEGWGTMRIFSMNQELLEYYMMNRKIEVFADLANGKINESMDEFEGLKFRISGAEKNYQRALSEEQRKSAVTILLRNLASDIKEEIDSITLSRSGYIRELQSMQKNLLRKLAMQFESEAAEGGSDSLVGRLIQ